MVSVSVAALTGRRLQANSKFEQNKSLLATKEDISGLKVEIANTKAHLLKGQVAMWATHMIAVLAGKFI